MTESPVEPLICKMAVPTIISMLITSIYNMADTFFVGRLGTSATGAVGVVFPLMALIQAVGFFFGQGSGNYISRQLGAQHREEAERMASTGFFSALGAGCIIMALGLLLRHPLAHLLGATDTILPYALDYMCIILIGAPYMTASLVLNNQLRLQGNAVYAMIGLVSGGVLNMALDPLFIWGYAARHSRPFSASSSASACSCAEFACRAASVSGCVCSRRQRRAMLICRAAEFRACAGRALHRLP